MHFTVFKYKLFNVYVQRLYISYKLIEMIVLFVNQIIENTPKLCPLWSLTTFNNNNLSYIALYITDQANNVRIVIQNLGVVNHL